MLDRSVDGVLGSGERHGEGVPGGGEHVPVMLGDGGPQDLVVAGQRCSHVGGVGFPQPRRTLDVGEHERHRPQRLRQPWNQHDPPLPAVLQFDKLLRRSLVARSGDMDPRWSLSHK